MQSLSDKTDALHEAIASLAAVPKTEESEEEHVLENFHSSRTIRKLILDSPNFAAALWKTALQGKCDIWAQGHRYITISTMKLQFFFYSCLVPYTRITENKAN